MYSQRNVANEAKTIPNVNLDPTGYAIGKLVEKLTEIRSTADEIKNDNQFVWFMDFSVCQLVTCCCLCFPCALYLTYASMKQESIANNLANTVLLNRSEVDSINMLSLALENIKKNAQAPTGQQSVFFAQNPQAASVAVARATITAIQNALAPEGIDKMRSFLNALNATIASAHNIQLENINANEADRGQLLQQMQI